MEDKIKVMVEHLIKEGVNMDIIHNTSRLSVKEIEEKSPVAYGKYVGARKQLLEMANNMLSIGYKKEKTI